jgi:hypothetical protein
MRRLVIALAIAVCPAAALAQSLMVNIDQSARITLPRPAHDVIIGNPLMADVTVLDERHILLMGKAYGVTNLLITDQAGRSIMNRQVVISAPDSNRVSVYRGGDVYNYACASKCERTPMPGERGSGAGVYDQWSPPFNDYSGRTHNAETNSAQSSTTP